MKNYFLQMIQHLRRQEEVMLYGNILLISVQEADSVTAYLKKAYQREVLTYPYEAPSFDKAAAQWAAKTIYLAAQLLLYRENKETDLPKIIEPFKKDITPSTILSADLCLRFLPEICKELRLIDPEDELIELLEGILMKWHYSAISYPINTEDLDFECIAENPCLHQLYADRVIQFKNQKLAALESMTALINANLGNYKTTFWKELEN